MYRWEYEFASGPAVSAACARERQTGLHPNRETWYDLTRHGIGRRQPASSAVWSGRFHRAGMPSLRRADRSGADAPGRRLPGNRRLRGFTRERAVAPVRPEPPPCAVGAPRGGGHWTQDRGTPAGTRIVGRRRRRCVGQIALQVALAFRKRQIGNAPDASHLLAQRSPGGRSGRMSGRTDVATRVPGGQAPFPSHRDPNRLRRGTRREWPEK